MKDTVTIELVRDEARPLLAQLEALQWLRVLPARKPKPRKWSGTLSKATAKSMHRYLQQTRNE